MNAQQFDQLKSKYAQAFDSDPYEVIRTAGTELVESGFVKGEIMRKCVNRPVFRIAYFRKGRTTVFFNYSDNVHEIVRTNCNAAYWEYVNKQN